MSKLLANEQRCSGAFPCSGWRLLVQSQQAAALCHCISKAIRPLVQNLLLISEKSRIGSWKYLLFLQ